MSIIKSIYEHLKTRRKYNTLKLKYEITREDLEKKQVEWNTERKIHSKQKEIWEQKLREQEEEIINLKKRKSRSKKKEEKWKQ